MTPLLNGVLGNDVGNGMKGMKIEFGGGGDPCFLERRRFRGGGISCAQSPGDDVDASASEGTF